MNRFLGWGPSPQNFEGRTEHFAPGSVVSHFLVIVAAFRISNFEFALGTPAMAASALLLPPSLRALQSRNSMQHGPRAATTPLPHHLRSLKPYLQPCARFATRNVTTSALSGEEKAAPGVVRKTVVPDPDYRVPLVLLGTAGALVYSDNLLPAVPIGLLGLLLVVQATRVKFVFDDDSLEVKVGEDLKDSGENVFVGGENKWSFSSFVNWEMWWPSFPVLVYFKETQTKPEGQIHFFPVIFNGKQLYDVMVERAGPSKNSGPKQ